MEFHWFLGVVLCQSPSLPLPQDITDSSKSIDRACVSSVVRFVYTINLVKTEDYTYVKMQGEMWAFAEIAFGLTCSCFPILPRLYQDAPSTNSYNGEILGTDLQDPSAKNSITVAASQAARWGSKGRENGGNWIHLDDRNVPGLPARTTVDVEHRTMDEDAVKDAVEGKAVGIVNDDLENGNRKHQAG